MVGGVEDVEDPLPERPRDDEAVVVQEQAVTLEHAVPRLPERAA